jgi:predicted nucleotidyltransferase
MPNRSSSSVVIRSRDRESLARAVKDHVRALRRKHPEIRRAIWFGSWISGVATPGSDVDLCLILSSSSKPLRDRLPDYLPTGFPVGIDLFPYTEEEFERLAITSPGWHAAITSGEEL